MDFRWGMIAEYMPLFIQGMQMTLGITVIAVVLGTLIGLLMGMARLAEAKYGWQRYAVRFLVRLPATAYVTFFRGTPLFVQILLIHFALMPALIHPSDGLLLSGDAAREIRQNYGAFLSGLVALTLNAGAYITEIFRAGIQSIDRGQTEAARSLGMSYGQTMKFVIVPQAFRRMLPPLANEFITLLKDSSLLSAIAVAELAYVQRTISGRFSIYEEPLYTIALIYLAMTMCLSWLFSWLEKRYNTAQR